MGMKEAGGKNLKQPGGRYLLTSLGPRNSLLPRDTGRAWEKKGGTGHQQGQLSLSPPRGESPVGLAEPAGTKGVPGLSLHVSRYK